MKPDALDALLQHQLTLSPEPEANATAERHVRVEAQDSLTLQCGRSSITLYANGKIVLRGDYILSDAESVNRIAGGQIDIN